METNYNIRISGGGTKEEILSSLNMLVSAISKSSFKGEDTYEWEDATLFTEISKATDEEVAEWNMMGDINK